MTWAELAELERKATMHRDENEGIAGGLPSEFKINRHGDVAEFLQEFPLSTCYEIAAGIDATYSATNNALRKMVRGGKLVRHEGKEIKFRLKGFYDA